MKNRILLENYYLPGDLEQQIGVFVDHYDVAMQTLSIIFECTTISVLFGVPVGIAMSKSDRLQKSVVPFLDLLQTLPTFVYLIPLIFLFSVT